MQISGESKHVVSNNQGEMMDTPAFETTRLVRPALLPIVLYISIIVVAMMAMVKPAQASGTVPVVKNAFCHAVGYTAYSNASLEACFASGKAALTSEPYVSNVSCQKNDYNVNGFSYVYWCAYTITAPGYLDQQYKGVAYGGIANACPPKSYSLNSVSLVTTCTCYPGYVPDAAGTSCVASCPAHASRPSPGTPCTCDVGYKFDAAGTSCIPEQYTISLSGLGIEVMPTKKLETAYAKVTKSDGTAKSGAQVHLNLTVIPEDDGLPYSSHVGSISTNGGSTGADGRLNFTFTAPVAGGVHTVTATCTNCTNQATGKITVPGCGVPELRKVEDIPPNGSDVLPLTLELDRTRGAGLALLPDAQAGVNCVKLKEPGTVITGGTRTLAYQAHLKEIWDKSEKLNQPKNLENKACQPLRDKVEAEKGCNGGHCITYPPAENSDHPKGTAFDVSRASIKGLIDKLRPPPDLQLPPRPPLTPAQQRQADVQLIADWLASPLTCNLVWGGSYGDRVHFSIP